MLAMVQQDCATRLFTTPDKGKQRLTQSQLDNIAHEVGFEYTRAKDLLNYATFETDMLIEQIQSIEPGQVAPSESNSVTRMDLAALVTKRCGPCNSLRSLTRLQYYIYLPLHTHRCPWLWCHICLAGATSELKLSSRVSLPRSSALSMDVLRRSEAHMEGPKTAFRFEAAKP